MIVAGTSGSGKTTVARLVSDAFRMPRIEIDGLFHGPGWVKRPSFEADVERFTAGPSWIVEWQYDSVRDLLADRADLLIWLDISRARVMSQVVRRTVVRRVRRRKLWNGNVEPPLHTFFTDPDHIVRWAWKSHDRTGSRVRELHERRPDLPIVRLRNRPEIAGWLSLWRPST